MEKKIIEVKKVESDGTCLTCCKKEATISVTINRLLEYHDTVISFHVCDECLAKMQREIEICE